MTKQLDRHWLYQNAVQCPEADIEFCIDTYQALYHREPMSLREDFCGTAYLSVEWCKTNPKRTAIGVDLCGETLEWGMENNILPAGNDIAKRITLRQEDVRSVIDTKTDITCALNFSYCVFKTREEIKEYFSSVLDGLEDEGILVLDLYGGTEAIIEHEEDREVGDFTYVWEQEKYNPITHETVCHIHFDFDDGSRMERAYSYDWRLWTIPELKECLLEVGFSKVRTFWEEIEDEDESDDEEVLEGSGRYIEVEEVENQEGWLVYIVAEV